MKRNIDHLSTREKLLELAAVLEKVQPERFDMGAWARSDAEPTLDALVYAQAEPNCGTSACALGVAACAFEGLEWSSYPWRVVVARTESGHWVDGYEAGAAFFGIDVFQAVDLFGVRGGHYQNSREVVIARLRALAERY